ncbi:MAG: hypothetical protein Edafosvirus4_59 [Edafosvirus sp.]|uniref:Uncharacterized protein n=1 Tax=Edafosvirus sp. TaxID=2487765 RepID=A0A3G4ZT61_9VIRU|nr:MAG: hypothetical protein Edafosvirus4_59 [Edafosvirus sp.]
MANPACLVHITRYSEFTDIEAKFTDADYYELMSYVGFPAQEIQEARHIFPDGLGVGDREFIFDLAKEKKEEKDKELKDEREEKEKMKIR